MSNADLKIDAGGTVSLSVGGGTDVALSVARDTAIDLKAGGEMFASDLKCLYKQRVL